MDWQLAGDLFLCACIIGGIVLFAVAVGKYEG